MRPRIVQELSRFCSDQSGATAIEYALIASGVAGAVVAVVSAVGTSVHGMYQSVSDGFK